MATISHDSTGTVSLGWWEHAIQLLIVLNMVTFAIETMPNLSPQWHRVLWHIEAASVLAFTVEYVVRLTHTRPWHRYALSVFGIVDLLAIVPFYLGLVVDLRSLRALRLMRLVRVLKLARYGHAAQRFERAFHLAKEELVVFGAAVLILLYIAAVGIHFFESDVQPEKFSSVFDSMWWAVATLTTVGYGDVYPVTVGGKIFTFLVLLMGLGLVAVPTGLLVSALARARVEEAEAELAAAREREKTD